MRERHTRLLLLTLIAAAMLACSLPTATPTLVPDTATPEPPTATAPSPTSTAEPPTATPTNPPAPPATASPPPSEPSITVLSPNGGEKWMEGGSYAITWEASGIETVDLALATGGKDLGFIATDVDAELGGYAWEIPSGLISGFGVCWADAMRLRISDSTNPSRYDENDAPFTITAPRIEFAPSGTVGLVTGDFQRGSTGRHVLWAADDQAMIVSVAPPGPGTALGITGASGSTLVSPNLGTDFAAVASLPRSQDYCITVDSIQRGDSYTLRVAIPPSGARPQRITFEEGGVSGAVDGVLQADGDHARYVLRAMAGQQITVELSAKWPVGIWLEGADGSSWRAPYGEHQLTVDSLPATQDYTITLVTPPNAQGTDYTLYVTIPSP